MLGYCIAIAALAIVVGVLSVLLVYNNRKQDKSISFWRKKAIEADNNTSDERFLLGQKYAMTYTCLYSCIKHIQDIPNWEQDENLRKAVELYDILEDQHEREKS